MGTEVEATGTGDEAIGTEDVRVMEREGGTSIVPLGGGGITIGEETATETEYCGRIAEEAACILVEEVVGTLDTDIKVAGIAGEGAIVENP